MNKPELKEGELYAGILLGKNGEPDHHVILLPGQGEKLTWAEAKEWATNAGGELPTRREQSLVYANLPEQFAPRWYWSSEEHAAYPDFAWLQTFVDGSQNDYRKDSQGRARAIRRLKI